MKVVGLIGSERKNGNSELAVKYIARKLNAELEILRLTKLNFEPCKACYACLYGKDCEIDDDVNIVLEKIEGADVVIVSSPVYFLDATSKIKALIDRGFLFVKKLDKLAGKKCVVITCHGFEEARGWASSTNLMLARIMYLDVLANIEIFATLPAEVLAKKENVEKLDLAVELLEKGERIVFEGQCPVCLNPTFRYENRKFICPLCLSEFDLDFNILKRGRWWVDKEWFEEHFFKELIALKEEFKKRKDELKKYIIR